MPSLPSRRLLPLLACLTPATAEPPVRFSGDLDVAPTADGGLRPVVGVHQTQVYRANRSEPAHADRLADTYLHAPMLCHWRGHYHLEYLSGPRDEHQPPCSTSLTRSTDGIDWEPPRILFPAFELPDGSQTIAHQRMGFYVAPDDRLLALCFYGKAPKPNDGTGLGRAVREIREDGGFGPIHFLRVNSHRAFPEFDLPYPPYHESDDPGFVAACESLLADRLMTAQWWEEEMLDESGFYRIRGKALSFVERPDGSHLGIWKNRLVATTDDRGESWTEKEFAAGLPNNGSKYWLQRTSDDRYALVLNPTARNRYPLALMTGDDSATFDGLLAVHGELPDQRFEGFMKNMGPQYVRGIVPGNGTPPDAGEAFPLVYSVNKEDLWFARVPVPVTGVVTEPVDDDFDAAEPGGLPGGWNIYSPVWAPVRIVAEGDGHALLLRDEDPHDYARAVRVFPETHGLEASFRVLPRQTGARFEIDLENAAGLRPVRIAFGADGRLRACHEAQWMDMGEYRAGEWLDFELRIASNPHDDRCEILVDGESRLPRPIYFTDPVESVERLSFRTGKWRPRGYGGIDLDDADRRAPLAEFLVDDVTVTPRQPEP